MPKWLIAFICTGLVVAVVGTLFVMAWNGYERERQAQSAKTRTVIEALEREFFEQCRPGIDRSQGEALLSRLGFTLYFKRKTDFYVGNYLRIFPATPPDEADGYVLGRTQLLGRLGLFQAYLEAIIFVAEDGRVLSCLSKRAADAL